VSRACRAILQWKRDGVVHAGRKVKIVTETPVLAVVDGLHGFGQTVTPQAVAIGIEKCKAMGLSMVALKNAGHIGRVGDWAEMAARPGSSRCISSTPRAACWWRPSAAPSAALDGAVLRGRTQARRGAGGAGLRHVCRGREAKCWWRARAARSSPTTP
jgi:hypothetical protein